MDELRIVVSQYDSPCGPVLLGSCGDSLCLCDWIEGRHGCQSVIRLQKALCSGVVDGNSLVIEQAKAQLDEYFEGRRREFDVPLLFTGSDFRKTVWRTLLDIPFGKTVTYGNIAKQIGCPTAVRAVANAIGANMLSIFVPCHRVVGATGSLTGYAGGLATKKYLLELEARNR